MSVSVTCPSGRSMPIGLSWRARNKGSCIVQLTMKSRPPASPAATKRLGAMLAAVCTINRITIAKHGCLPRRLPFAASASMRRGSSFELSIDRRVKQLEPDLSDRIRERAYEIWVASGYRDGEAEQHWLAAEQEVLSAQRSAAVPSAPVKRLRGRATPKRSKG